jgi:N-acetylmuramoyl-L-alanine amidase
LRDAAIAVRERASPNTAEREPGVPVDVLVLHYTGMPTAAGALDRLCDPAARVSSHYLVDEDGTVWRLVDEARTAFHAGVSAWRGHEALNARSVGVEIVNPGHEWGYRAFPAPQMDAVEALCRAVLGRHPIPPRNVVAHSDVAPERKEDPGELFPWAQLADRGIGLWPLGVPDLGCALPVTDGAGLRPVRAALAGVGYRLALEGAQDDALAAVLRAFQRHWRPERVTGLADRGTRARLAALHRLVATAG